MKIQGVFPGQNLPEGHAGDVAVAMLNLGVAAIERADRITRASTAAEARDIALDLLAIMAGLQMEIAEHDWDRWPVGGDDDE